MNPWAARFPYQRRPGETLDGAVSRLRAEHSELQAAAQPEPATHAACNDNAPERVRFYWEDRD